MGVSAEWAARREEELRNSPHWASIQAGRDKRKAHALESIKRFGNEYWKHPEYKKENPRQRPMSGPRPTSGLYAALAERDAARPTQTPVQQPPSGTPHPRRPAVKPHAGGYQRAGNYPPPPTGQPPSPAGAARRGGEKKFGGPQANPGGGTYETSPGYLAGHRFPWYEPPTTTSGGVAGSAAPWRASQQPPAPAGTSGPRVITPLPGAIGNTPAAPSFAADLYNEGVMRRNQQNRPLAQRYRPLTQTPNSYNNYIGQIRNNLRPLGYQPINR